MILSIFDPMKFIAKTLHGLEPVLVQELEELGAKEIRPLKRAVAFEGDKALLYQANYQLRTAIRVLRPIYHFVARSERQLYHKIYSYNWAMHFDVKKTFAITSNVHSSFFNHSKYVALKAKDAIVDQFRNKSGKRPSISTSHPDVLLNIHVNEDEFTVSLDSSGESLHRREYRDIGHAAPLNEALAAGMLKLAGWDKSKPLLDAMCGTGTILFEAAMMGSHTPTGYYKKERYNFQNWNDYDDDLFQKIKAEADAKIDYSGLQLKGGDNNPTAVKMALSTIQDLGFDDFIEIERVPFKRHEPSFESGILMMNPPYGERLQIRNINAFYKEIGDILKQQYTGWDAWIISSNFEAMKNIGLRPSKRHTLFNGALECKFQRFSMYQGTKKQKWAVI